MKNISIKLPDDEAKELEAFILRRKYPSKSEFIRNLIIEKLDTYRKEKIGWLIVAQESMGKIWDNPKDGEVWKSYL